MNVESADLVTDPGWKFLIYAAEPGSPSADALALLSSWVASEDVPELAPQPDAAVSEP